ncbi:antibiotic biosynthesis monooxygenase [Allosaccharopolyspora coralli]|uniref:Antibiotic biosynthesis monooxygenase n=1 Tax=Allosaccharopolyspora coralli TaxID=2665642 RepID=A0A5Q3QC98_9PSEU|nr:putative quinol monooxygenase [Allosaccharopolyspora coralli]QGK69095.1 antibiotic biosynthesis monooxygenase [Allosaccharopolyspora coralli]
MILIVVKFTIKPEHSDRWISLVDEFTQATRSEPGNLFFDWSRSVDDANQYVLVEGFASPEAGEQHVNSDHFGKAMSWIPQYLATTPQIINIQDPEQTGFGEMGEMAPAN